MDARAWESERQRVSLYVERRRRARQAFEIAVWRRVNAHAAFLEHAHARRRLEAAANDDHDVELDVEAAGEDEPAAGDDHDLALDFLGDVNADDMRSLLVDAVTAPSVATVSEPVSAMAPIEMPSHLLSILSTASAASVNMSTVTGVTVGVSLGEDVGVSELMDELQIDVQTLATPVVRQRSGEQEAKTEESTPPRHVRDQRALQPGERVEKTPNSSKPPPATTSLAEPWMDVFDTEAAAANEMESWVTGNNAPEVIQRRETLRGDKKRKTTKRLGTETYEYQTTMRRVAKYHAGEGDSSSSSDESKEDSDFSPQEVVEIDDDEDGDEPFSETELLPDDYVGDEGEDEADRRRFKTPARKRIRQRPRTKMTIRKNPLAKSEPKKSKKITERREEKAMKDKKREHREEKKAQPPEETIDLMSDSDDGKNREEEDVDTGLDYPGEPEREPSSDEPVEAVDGGNGGLILKLKVAPKDLLELAAKEQAQGSGDKGVGTLPPSVSEQAASTPAGEDMQERSEVESQSVDKPEDGESKESVPDEGHQGEDAGVGEVRKEVEPMKVVAPPEAQEKETDSMNAVPEEVQFEPIELVTQPPARKDETDLGNATVAPQEMLDEGAVLSGVDEDGYATDDLNDAALEPDELSDTGTIDLDDQELEEPEEIITNAEQPPLETGKPDGDVVLVIDKAKTEPGHEPDKMLETNGSPASTSGATTSDESNKLHPVEPQVKMSPQQSTPPSNARALNADSPPAKPQAKKGERVVDSETVNFEEVSSELDFGSGESDDYAGEVDGGDDEEAEFGQFFSSGATKQMKRKVPTESKRPPLAPDAISVKKIRTEEPATSSPQTKQASPLKKAGGVPPTTAGSNGLRKVPNINTTIVAKGKFQHTRRAIRVLDDKMEATQGGDEAHDPKKNLISRSRLISSSGPPPTGEVSPRTIRPLALRGQSQPRESRYLGYEKKSAGNPYADVAKQVREKYDKSSVPKTSVMASQPVVTFDASSVGTGAGVLKPLTGMQTSDGGYVPPRDPQLDVYIATGAISQYDTDDDKSLSELHKRPLKYAKQIEEAKKRGENVKKGKPVELDPKARIPKKSAEALAKERATNKKTLDPVTTKSSKRDRDNGDVPSKAKRAKGNKSSSSEKPSHYGPSATSEVVRRNQDESNRYSKSSRSGSDSYKRKRDDRGHDRSRNDRSSERKRGSDRERSRDGRDRESKRHHDYSSRSRDKDRERRDRDRRDRSQSPADNHRRHNRSKSPSSHRISHDRPSKRDLSRSHSRSPSRSRSRSESKRSSTDDRRRKADGQTKSHHEEPRRSSLQSYEGAENLARSMNSHSGPEPQKQSQIKVPKLSLRAKVAATGPTIEEGEDSDIVESDDHSIGELEEDIWFDIRYDLRSVKVDHDLLERMVYVTNLPPSFDEDMMIEKFHKFGIAENREIGCLAVDVFLCQRTHRSRGDARITFTSPEAANLAVEEINNQYCGSNMLFVQRMNVPTMKILTAQFDIHRDTWVCSNELCRKETSTWTRSCGSCGKLRQFPKSSIKIREGDWLCALCFANNDEYSSKCNGCEARLPQEIDYRSQRSSR